MAVDLFLRFHPVPLPGTVSVATVEDPGSGSTSAGSGGSRPGRRSPLSESEVATAIERLPPLPAVATRILEMVGSDSASARDLEDLVRLDPVISARLLKLVNSPFYGLSNKVSSIAQAVTMVGFGGIKSLVVACSMSEMLHTEMSAYGFTANGPWKNGLACGAMAKAIAIETGVVGDTTEVYFLGGLMRDIGLLITGPELTRRGKKLLPSTDERLAERERTCIGVDHVGVGLRLAEKWRLPPAITACIGEHHAPPGSWSPAHVGIVASVRLAERLAFTSRIGMAADHPFETKIDPTLIKAAGLDMAHLQNLMKRLPGVIASAEIPL